MSKLMEVKFPGGCKSLPEGFWSAVDVWVKKPHVVNKRLCGAKESDGEELDEEHLGLLFLFKDLPLVLQELLPFLDPPPKSHQNQPWSSTIRTFIPKLSVYGAILHRELILKDFSRQQVTFLPFEEDAAGKATFRRGNVYQIQLHSEDCEDWRLELRALALDSWFSDGVAYPNVSWLSHQLMPKLVRWASESRRSDFCSTLSLLPVEKYGATYQRMKDKYKSMVEVWPEVTDPEKFVYEDVAIATYLLVLWAEERALRNLSDKQSFVDLGCGNGLLVHILTNEGHPGNGLDVRRRKIWDMYGPETQLEEKAVTPGDGCLFPATDWLIGNHSDELTPWIPVMAARSSYSCRYFVLPCCFFDFYGKYQRRQCQTSQYKEYIQFISEVSRVSGFHTEEDCLRIPSTKRVCLVGTSRNYRQCDEAEAERRRSHYVLRRRRVQRSDGEDGEGAGGDGCRGNAEGDGFRPRDRVETVRNCAALPRELVEGVVLRVANAVLGMTASRDEWNQGGSLSVGEVAALLEQETLQQLKKECGGLQTLLKNNHQVFRVEGGRVFIRDWRDKKSSRAENNKRKPVSPGAIKTRPCWFHRHHPQGCPLVAESCAFAHGADDLRPSTKPLKKMKNSAFCSADPSS